MTLDADSFLALCKELRKLGACKVEGFGFAAVFVPQTTAQTGPVSPAKRAAKAAARREDEPTDEQKREAMYARELGAH
jgi:hypothetical protein